MLERQRFEPHGRLAQFMRLVDVFERCEIGETVDALIACLDAIDGDPDMEPDDLDECGAADDGCGFFIDRYGKRGWGGEGDDADFEETAVPPEWMREGGTCRSIAFASNI